MEVEIFKSMYVDDELGDNPIKEINLWKVASE